MSPVKLSFCISFGSASRAYGLLKSAAINLCISLKYVKFKKQPVVQ